MVCTQGFSERTGILKKLSLKIAALLLFSTSQVEAQLDFHYNWLDQAEIDACFWQQAEGWAPQTGVNTANTAGRLRLQNSPGAWTHFSTVEKVVRPNPATDEVEIIVDLWEDQDGLAAFAAVYEAGIPRPGRPAAFDDPSFALGATWRSARNPPDPGWTMCVNGGCPQGPPGTYPGHLPVRMRYTASPGSGVTLEYRRLDAATGEFLDPSWQFGANRPAPDADLNLDREGTDKDAPYHFGFSVLGKAEFGMVEVYQSTGNDGTIPAPGNSNDARPAVLPQNGFQTPRGACDSLPGGLCDELTAADCTAAGGSYQGDGTSCLTGACSLPGGGSCGDGCILLSSGACDAAGGTYGGDGTTCGSGACQLPGGTCSILGSSECATLGGTYLGDDATCPAVSPILDYHYNWLGQGEGAGGGVNPADWSVGPNLIAGVTALGRFSLIFDVGGGPWRSVSSVADVVRPHPTTGAVEMIVDIWSKDGHHNFHAQYAGMTHSAGSFNQSVMALAATHTGSVPGPGAPGWTLCVNGANCAQLVNEYSGTVPVRIRLSSSGQPGAGVNLDARLLDPDTGQFAAGSDWFPDPATNHGFDLDLTRLGVQAPPFKFAFSQLGRVEYGMVEVYQNLGNDGSLPAPGNNNETPPSPLPCNGFQDDCPTGGDNTNIPGDCNQDGAVDLSDAICTLGFLFQNNPETLPCSSTAGNLGLMDVNNDDSVDLSDAIYLLAFLFQGGATPVQGQGCISMANCPQNVGCP